jgi:DNA-binding transcriptional LysR family regulator
MKLSQLDGLVAFACVAEKRSFTAAAAALEVSPSAVSQAVKQLEARLGVRLLNRSTRSVGLTEAGQQFLMRVAPAVSELMEASHALDAYRGGVTGLLRITASRVVHAMLLRPLIPGFLAAHGGLRLEVALEDGFTDIVAAGFDAGVRLGDSVERDMVAMPLTASERACLVAAPGYVARHGLPRSIGELQRHACIRFRFPGSGAIYRWELMRDGREVEVEVDGPLTVSDSASLAPAALDGIGIAYTFERLVAADLAAGRLLPVLPEAWITFPGFYLYYPHRRQQPAKLTAFIDYCRSRLSANPAPPSAAAAGRPPASARP